MYLSQIEIVGFKSFAVKTQVKFTPGMTAIVGPNGCGKTNVVDALRWALGEQKASTLRSDKMHDVIFNGTKNRRPLGLAEVSLTIQNNRGILPTEYTEVKMTRRLFRSGESQYLLNGTECRLRDITDLFMDTGMGPDAYSVIELKMIETILSSRADERRRLFEEAAGVTKYKTRRREAERKLESVQSDLSRINDIVVEVEKVVRSLSRQAAKAKLAAEIGDKLGKIERALLRHEYAQILRQTLPLAERIQAEQSEKARRNEELQSAEERLAALEEAQRDIQTRLHIAEAAFVEAQRKQMSASQERAVAAERLLALERGRERALQEAQELRASVEQTEIMIAEHRAALAEAERELEDVETEYNRLKQSSDEMQAQAQSARSNVRACNDAVMRALNEINAARASSERAIASVNALRARISETEQAIARQEEKLFAARQEHEQAQARSVEYNERIGACERKLEEARLRSEELQAQISAAQSDIASLQAEASGKAASLEFLEGLSSGADAVQFLQNAPDWRPESAIAAQRITLAEAISTDARYRVALESALGEAAGYFLVETPEEAAAGIAALKAAGKGKATFICLQRVPRLTTHSIHSTSVANAVGAQNLWLSEQATSDDERALFALRALLGATLFTENLETAKKAVESGSCDAAVTPEGEIVRKNGVWKGGGANSAEGASIGRAEQIEALRAELQTLRDRVAERRAHINEKTVLLKEIHLPDYADALRRAEAEKHKHEQTLGQLRFQIESLEESLEQKRNDSERFREEIRLVEESQERSLGEGAGALEELAHKKRAAEERLAEAERALAAIEEETQMQTEETRAAEMRLIEARSESRSLASALERLESSIEALKERSLKREREAKEAEAEHEEVERSFAGLESALAQAQAQAAEAEAARDAVAVEQNELRRILQGESESLRSLRRDAEAATARLHKTELDFANARTRLNSLAERALEEFAIDFTAFSSPEELEDAAESDNATLFEDQKFDISRLKDEAKSLKEQIKSIGAVNPLAAEEYDRENTRLEFLQNQFKDLQESERTLRQTIQEINQTAQKQFYDVFERIRTNFIHIFKTLFNEGDEADLQIEEGDPLEAPIKIIAKPRGKRPASIEMLSGGEKTLTAIALLFAIYLVKPSPFCILDEVDAPLDDANIGRYLKLIRSFSDATQFIMITHNKLTMEAADTLYGVTMQEEGVSKLVSVQFSQYLGDGRFAAENGAAKNGAAKNGAAEALA
jgi:chromosome segregation protein